LVKQGKVQVNGAVITDPATKVCETDGEPVLAAVVHAEQSSMDHSSKAERAQVCICVGGLVGGWVGGLGKRVSMGPM